MMLILLVYYVIIAFLIDTNVIADPASVPAKNESSSIIVFNGCSQDPPCFVSYNIGFGDVTLYTSRILDSAEKISFPYKNTTDGLHIKFFKHTDYPDYGVDMFTKQLGDGNHCFAVSGNWWTPKILNCSNVFTNATFDSLLVRNKKTFRPFIVILEFHSVQGTSTYSIAPLEEVELNFLHEPSSFSLFKKASLDSPTEIIQENITLPSKDVCIEISGNYEKPEINFTACKQPIEKKYIGPIEYIRPIKYVLPSVKPLFLPPDETGLNNKFSVLYEASDLDYKFLVKPDATDFDKKYARIIQTQMGKVLDDLFSHSVFYTNGGKMPRKKLRLIDADYFELLVKIHENGMKPCSTEQDNQQSTDKDNSEKKESVKGMSSSMNKIVTGKSDVKPQN